MSYPFVKCKMEPEDLKFAMKNSTKTLRVKYLRTYKEMSVGLLGATRAYPVTFKTRFGIHTFFMKFPIDILILDNEGRVVSSRENLKPFRIFLWNPQNSRVVELPAGTIEKLGIKKLEVINLVKT